VRRERHQNATVAIATRAQSFHSRQTTSQVRPQCWHLKRVLCTPRLRVFERGSSAPQ